MQKIKDIHSVLHAINKLYVINSPMYRIWFYIDQNVSNSNIAGFTEKWLEAIKNAIPGFKPNIKPSGNGGNVSKAGSVENWVPKH